MTEGNAIRKSILFLGDIALLYFGLFVTLIIRYQTLQLSELWAIHLNPFSIIIVVWLLIFFITGLYDTEKSSLAELNSVIKTMIVCGAIAGLMFYFISFFGIAPKTNLAIYVLVTFLLIWGWRMAFLSLSPKIYKTKILILDESPDAGELAEFVRRNPHLGYELVEKVQAADILIVSPQVKQNPALSKFFYQVILSGKTIIDFSKFYELAAYKIPVQTINEIWLLENLIKKHRGYDILKRPVEFLIALVMLIIALPIMLIELILIKTTSNGPGLFTQIRVGKNGRQFKVLKFRSMFSTKPAWLEENDSRVTPVGKVLRALRADELPQLWNILKGDLSFIGPRPDIVEFYEVLEEQIPYYRVRNMVTPGLTGWAQINNQFGGTVDEARNRLAYEIYYLKNRSLALDVMIWLKTLRTILSGAGK